MDVKKIVLLIVIMLGVASIPILNENLGSGGAKLVEISELSEQIIRPSILASGKLSHDEEVRLSSEVIGKVASILIEEGDSVVAGQLVLRVDDQNFVAALQQSEAQVRLSKIDIERQTARIENLGKQWKRKNALFKQGMVGDDEFDNLSHQLKQAKIDLKSSRERLLQAEAQLEQADDRLRKTQITSPLSGIVTSLDIKVGETAIASATNIPGSTLMTISNPKSIYTEVLVDEADVASIAVGQKAEIVAIAYPDKPMEGVVRFIASTAKVAQGRQGLSFTVKIDITEHGEVLLHPGMSCRAEIFSGSDLALPTVPIQAILIDEDLSEGRIEHYVFISDDGIARKSIVEVGISDDEYQEIISGLDSGVKIITGPAKELRHLKDGDDITIEEDS
ncbi:MAG: efflux RND transporter periplasmic adaptor subunit [Pseudomonadales bacterium]|nr:efflux RND transporter periplasmic adaptor subunit [Pseudomonadales bacterium]